METKATPAAGTNGSKKPKEAPPIASDVSTGKATTSGEPSSSTVNAEAKAPTPTPSESSDNPSEEKPLDIERLKYLFAEHDKVAMQAELLNGQSQKLLASIHKEFGSGPFTRKGAGQLTLVKRTSEDGQSATYFFKSPPSRKAIEV